tara:strand:+ start:293 stop:535 length:243 start_codon:yes stop_codon:yes gene_type:complete
LQEVVEHQVPHQDNILQVGVEDLLTLQVELTEVVVQVVEDKVEEHQILDVLQQEQIILAAVVVEMVIMIQVLAQAVQESL